MARPMCESCGMPLKRDPEGGGTNTDGSRSTVYCSFCYADGAFKHPDWTADQMRQFSKDKLKEMGFPGFIAHLFTKGIPRLERWKSQTT